MPTHHEVNHRQSAGAGSVLDCVVVGGGPAGLTAGLYLRRFLRNVRVIDAGGSRARRISRSNNLAGFPDGISGPQLLQLMEQHLQRVGGHVVRDTVRNLQRRADGSIAVALGEKTLRTRAVLLCTGVKDRLPTVEGAAAVVAADLVRQCPICDGFEHRGKQIGVLGNSIHGVREAVFLQNFSREVCFIGMDGCTEELQAAVRAADLRSLPGRPKRLAVNHDGAVGVTTDDGADHRFDVLYAALGVDPCAQLAAGLDARQDEVGNLIIDAHGRTSVGNLFAAGDVVHGLDQIGVAVGQAAIAATSVHNSL